MRRACILDLDAQRRRAGARRRRRRRPARALGGAARLGQGARRLYLTEPHASSDATAITTRGTKTGAAWVVSGTKAWVTLGGVASALLVVAKTEEEPGHRDIALFVIDAADPGVRFSEPYRKAASDFLPITNLELDEATAHLLVPPGQGMAAALGAIDVARFDIAAISNGLHAEALDVAVRYTSERSVFGKPVNAHQGIAWALADVATELEPHEG